MRLFLVRHAEAGDPDPARWPDDRQRPLTERGRAEHGQVTRALQRMGLRFDRLLTSPLARARETAEMTAAGSGWTGPVEVTEALGDRARPEDLLAPLGQCDPASTVLCVGHEPNLSRLAALLIGSDGRARIELRKSGVIAVDFDGPPSPGRGTLRFHLRPDDLTRLLEGA